MTTVSGILRHYAGGFVRNSRTPVCWQVRSVLAKLDLCRTAALGEHHYRCNQCGHECRVYNSCGDRHCPQCAGAKRANWLASTAELLLPQVPYFQVVFTIPDKLSSLALGNRKVMFDLLFHTAWSSLKRTVAGEQQFEPAAVMALHTWNQHLDAHIHVYALVPGGGPSLLDEGIWKWSRPPAYENQRRPWLVEADQLRVAFREDFLKGLRRLHAAEQLTLTGDWSDLRDPAAFEAWLQPLATISWVTYIEKPPENSTPEHVLKYLARYMTGGPISDRRIVRHEHGQVTFTARVGTTHGGSDQTEEVTLPGEEFVRRWSLHILPQGYTRTRRFGGYSYHHVRRYLGECRDLLNALQLPESRSSQKSLRPDGRESERVRSPHLCPRCQTPLQLLSYSDRPSWWVLLAPLIVQRVKSDDG